MTAFNFDFGMSVFTSLFHFALFRVSCHFDALLFPNENAWGDSGVTYQNCAALALYRIFSCRDCRGDWREGYKAVMYEEFACSPLLAGNQLKRSIYIADHVDPVRIA